MLNLLSKSLLCYLLALNFGFSQQAADQLQQNQPATSVTTPEVEPVQIAAVRVANMLPDVPGVDLSVDGRLRIQDVVYGAVSGYILIPVHQVKLALMPHVPIDNQGEVIEGNQPPELIPFAATLEPDRYYTIVFSYAETSEFGEQIFRASLVSIFENTFETPLPGQARIRLNNTSALPISLVLKQQEENQEELNVLETLEIPLLSTKVLHVPAGVYTFSFGEEEADLEFRVQAGTFYTLYVFRDGEDLVINPDVDGVLGMLMDTEMP